AAITQVAGVNSRLESLGVQFQQLPESPLGLVVPVLRALFRSAPFAIRVLSFAKLQETRLAWILCVFRLNLGWIGSFPLDRTTLPHFRHPRSQLQRYRPHSIQNSLKWHRTRDIAWKLSPGENPIEDLCPQPLARFGGHPIRDN